MTRLLQMALRDRVIVKKKAGFDQMKQTGYRNTIADGAAVFRICIVLQMLEPFFCRKKRDELGSNHGWIEIEKSSDQLIADQVITVLFLVFLKLFHDKGDMLKDPLNIISVTR